MNQPDRFWRSFRDEHTRVLRILLSSLSEADLAIAEAQVQRELTARADQERNALRLLFGTLTHQELIEVQQEILAQRQITAQVKVASVKKRTNRKK